MPSPRGRLWDFHATWTKPSVDAKRHCADVVWITLLASMVKEVPAHMFQASRDLGNPFVDSAPLMNGIFEFKAIGKFLWTGKVTNLADYSSARRVYVPYAIKA